MTTPGQPPALFGDGRRQVTELNALRVDVLGAVAAPAPLDGRVSVSYCLYDTPSQEAVQELAEVFGLPVDQITEVVLDPYFHP